MPHIQLACGAHRRIGTTGKGMGGVGVEYSTHERHGGRHGGVYGGRCGGAELRSCGGAHPNCVRVR